MDVSLLDVHIDEQMNQCVDLVRQVLGDDLLGCYLYGSSIVGGLKRYSDIDLFVVSQRATTLAEKEQLEKELMAISGVYGSAEKRPVEMTIVVSTHINPWHYPPSFDFQYGDWLRGKFEAGVVEPWESKVKPDLALVITQILLIGKTLYGADAGKLLPIVPYTDFMTALTDELESVRGDLDWDTRNVLLTLARMWCTVETDTIQPKQHAAEWAIERVPDEYKPVIQRALAVAIGSQEETWSDLQTLSAGCADFMMDKIREQMKVVNTRDNTQRRISVEM